MRTSALEHALLDPASAFDSPETVIARDDLTTNQKLEILQRWQFNVAEEEVALEEGMPGEESDLTRRILMAISAIAGPLDVEHTGPSKNHSLPRAARKPGHR